MTTIELKNQLDHLGIVLSVMGDNLNYRAPKGSMTPELLNKIKAHKAELIDLLSTTSANRKQFITLNPLQQRLVYVNQLHGQSVSYNAFLGFHFEGAIKPALLEAVFFKIIQRHEAFRSRLVTHKNQRCLEVVEQVPFELLQEDCTAISEVAFQEKLTTFAQQNLNFETCPLLTVKLYKRASQQYTIAILSHHFIIDGWSLNLLATELWNTYFDPTITCPPTLRLFDAEHQRHQIEKKHAEKEFKYWKQKLANATLHIDFPYDEQPGVPQRESNAIDCLLLSSEEYAPIKQIGQNYGASTFMVNTTALQFVLSCFAQQNNFVIGTAISNREGNKLANTIGSFSNTLLIDCKTDVQKTFTDHLQEMRKTMLEAYANSHLPYQEVVSALDRKHLSDEIVQVMVVQQTAPSFQHKEVSYFNVDCGKAKFEMGIYFIENEQGLNLLIEYRKDLFAANTISGLIDYLKAVLLQIGSNPMDKVHQLIQSADYPFSIQHSPEAARPTGTFHGEFAQQVFKNGDALAVISQDQCLTYSELDQKSTAWAHYLKQQGWGKGDLLGLGVNRSPESIIGMLAILKIGAAYVPIDPTYPSQIKSHILNTKNLQGCVVPDELAQQFASSSFPILTFNDIDVKHNANHSPLAVAVHSNDPMYVIYTSGSTGLPKGVMATHGNVLSLAKALKQTLYPNNQPLRFSLNGSMAFDTSVKQLCSLLYGGGLVFIPQAIRFDGLELIQYLEKQQVNILDVTPSQFTFLKLENFLHQWKHKKQVLFGGEKVSTALWEEAAAIPDLQCYNLYGITECTVDSTLTAISTAQEVNVGKVLHGTSVYILNESLEPVPQGMTGEIYIGGANVTIGYWDQSSLTASKFLPDPFVQQSGARMYKTGDCGKLLADGRLVLSGRIDRELKIRGYRFKPEFIESILNKHPRIQQAGVLVNKQQSNQISAFIQAKKQVENGLYQLPNGLSMSYLNSNEIEFLYRDIFENNAYLRHGIQLPKNACVLDVGANIGMFSLLINRLAPEATIYSFEPNPHVYHKLAQNVARYQIKGAAFNYGLSNEEKTAEFTFYPKFSFLSGLHADKQENMEMVQSYIRKTQASSSISDELIQTLLEDRFENESLTVALKTLSSFIATHQIQQIDLLKINVEKSELEVLKGLAPADWKKIKQLVFEFHDDKQELEEVTNMLKEQGYRVHVQQDWSTDQADQVYYIYASVYELNPSQDVPHEWMALGQDTLSNQQLNQYLSAYLPFGILPSAYTIVEEIPLTAQGKVDYQALQKYQQAVHIAAEDHSLTEVEQQVRNIWEELLGITVSRTSSFFEVGGHSLLLMALRDKIEQTFNYAIPITQLFDYPTISEQAHMIQQLENAQPLNLQTTRQPSTTHETTREAIAIIGMSMRLPEADSAAAFWNNLIHGHESISAWPKPQLIEDGVPETLFTREDYVNAAGVIQDYACFDANFFGYSNREASLMDPQHRLLLEYAWEALESAGYAPTNLQKPTGVYVGSSINSYMIHHIDRFKELIPELGSHQLIIANDKDHLATHIAYKLNLEGPAVTVQTACSTSLAAVHMACQSLKTGDSELAIAGGVSVRIPHHAGYIYQKGGILSPDGHCRSFDAAAQGTVPGSGIGLVVLKKLDAAIRDHDQIHAVILGSALNNDGGKKVGYTAPAVEGQARCIAKALKTAQVDPSAISYIEAHGTGTALGDPVEIAALNEVFKQDELKEKSCALGSVKSNIGHLDAAAGVAGLIKTVLALKHQTIPPSLHFNSPNQEIAFHQGPFYVNAKLKEWQSSSKRTAGVSSFGLGGTNAHVVLQEAPRIAKVQAVSSHFLFLFSAKSEHSLSQVLAKFLDFCQTPPEERLIDVAYTLMEGRACFDYRFACIASSYQELAECLQTALTHKDFRKATASSTPHVHILTLQEPVVRLQELRGRWLNGDLIRGDFSGGNMPYKVALPTYAFEKVIHWMEAPKIAHAHPRSSNVNQHDETQAAPDDAVEPFVKKAWESILGEQVESNTADFFEMGGNSLLAVQLLTRIQEKFGVEIEVIDLFDFPTVGELSAHIHSCIEPEQSSTQLLQDVDDLSEQELDFLIESFEITDEE